MTRGYRRLQQHDDDTPAAAPMSDSDRASRSAGSASDELELDSDIGTYIGNERVPIQLAQCRCRGLAISSAKI